MDTDEMPSEVGELVLVRPDPVHLTSDDDQLESREDKNKVRLRSSPCHLLCDEWRVLSPQPVIHTVFLKEGIGQLKLYRPI